MVKIIPANRPKSYLYWALGFLVLGAVLDLSCISGAVSLTCRGSFFMGAAFCMIFFGIPALIIHRFVPEDVKGLWLALPVCLLFYFAWIVTMTAVTEGPYRPSLIVIIGTIIMYRASTKAKIQKDPATSQG
jgi:hypothetical protein|tara:strand:+ start:2566 stop:2958 length:393 start_codon:yes stop_codon:yes gene_type:complete